jgi:predicted hydrolase (HD superfamily)
MNLQQIKQEMNALIIKRDEAVKALNAEMYKQFGILGSKFVEQNAKHKVGDSVVIRAWNKEYPEYTVTGVINDINYSSSGPSSAEVSKHEIDINNHSHIRYAVVIISHSEKRGTCHAFLKIGKEYSIPEEAIIS